MLKKSVLALLILFLSLVSLPAFAVSAEASERLSEATFVLPSSLEKIDEEAFASTQVKTVVFPEGFRSIGESAFENASFLTDVYIPPTTDYISATAFPTDSDIVIHGVEKSYAQEWAEQNRRSFVAENIWKLARENGRTVSIRETEPNSLGPSVFREESNKSVPHAEDENRSRRPQDRAELNPIDYRFP